MASSRSFPIRSALFRPGQVFALLLWISLWVNLNSGFWDFHHPNNSAELLEFIRAALPFAVLPVAGFFLFLRKSKFLLWNSPSRLLMWYGLIATFATVFSPEPLHSLYWSIAFLATILAAWAFIDGRASEDSARLLLQITWVATFVIAAILAYQTRGSVFSEASSAYGLVGHDLAGLSRSSGVARWAAVSGLVCLLRAYHSRRFIPISFFLGFAAVSFFIVYRMQSRGAIFGSVAALLFALLVSSRMRRYALPFAVLAAFVILILDSPATVSTGIAKYVYRGQSREQFRSMTGRTRAYDKGLVAIEDAPIFGRGQWADRIIIHEHVHNSYLQALMNAGIVGGIPYLASWITGWMMYFRLQKKQAWLRPEDRSCVLEAGTIMMFFTVRSIPETTTASFAVDLLVMVAVYVYLEVLSSAVRARERWQAAQAFVPVPASLNESGRSSRIEAWRRA